MDGADCDGAGGDAVPQTATYWPGSKGRVVGWVGIGDVGNIIDVDVIMIIFIIIN